MYYKKTYKGIFKPINPNKYRGNIDNIQYRSLWELKVMKYLDVKAEITWWASEEIAIQYLSPIDQRNHRYFPDFIIGIKDKTGNEKTYVVEVKPYEQTLQPVKKRKTQKFITEMATYAVNQAKWRAADIYCQKRGWEFMILTENELNLYPKHK